MSSITCKYPNPDPTTKTAMPKLTKQVTKRLFYPKCSKLNSLCAGGKPAYVCGTTICAQHLW
jgi:hypothetical protein